MKPTLLIISITLFCFILLSFGFIYFCAISVLINLGLAGWFALAKGVDRKQIKQPNLD